MQINAAISAATKLIRELNDKPQTVDSISERIGVPSPYLQSISRKLSKSKLLRVKLGPKGGLMSIGRKIDLLEVFRAVSQSRKKTSSPDLESKLNEKLLEIFVN